MVFKYKISFPMDSPWCDGAGVKQEALFLQKVKRTSFHGDFFLRLYQRRNRLMDLARLQDTARNFCQTSKGVDLPNLGDKASWQGRREGTHSEGQTGVHKSNLLNLDETVQMCISLCFLTERLLFKHE